MVDGMIPTNEANREDVATTHAKPTNLEEKLKPTGSKVLRFAESLNTTMEIPTLVLEEGEEEQIWYTPRSIEAFRRQGRRGGRNILRTHTELLDEMENLYVTAEFISDSLQDDVEFCQTLNTLLGVELTSIMRWCKEDDLWGLERAASAVLRNRKDRIRATNSTISVLDSAAPNGSGNLYRDMSRPAKLFARILGQAVSMALSLEEEGGKETEVEESRDELSSLKENEILEWKRSS